MGTRRSARTTAEGTRRSAQGARRSAQGARRSAQGTRRSARRDGGPRRGTAKSLLVALGVFVLVLVIACVADVAYSSGKATDEASRAMEAFSQMDEAVRQGDDAATKAAAHDLEERVHKVYDEVHGPAWYLASVVPVVGRDVRGMRAVSDCLVSVVDEALVPMVEGTAWESYGKLLRDGGVDLVALRSLSDALDGAAPVLEQAASSLSELPEGRSGSYGSLLASSRAVVGEAQAAVEALRALAPQAATLLGGSGAQRSYLVVVLANSEVRAMGGVPVAWGRLTAREGSLSLGSFGVPGYWIEMYDELSSEESELLDDAYEAFWVATALPNITRAADIVSTGYEWYEEEGIDGVLFVDVPFLQAALGLTGAVTLDDGTTLDQTNATWELVSGQCWRLDDRDYEAERLAEAASATLGRMVEGLGSVGMPRLVEALSGMAAQGHVQLWAQDEQLERTLGSLALAGAAGGDAPVLGVYLNDAIGSKAGWYLGATTEVLQGPEEGSDAPTYRVRTTIKNHAWAEELAAAPSNLSASGAEEKGSVDDLVISPVILAPEGASVQELSVEGDGTAELARQDLYGRSAYVGTLHVAAGQQVVLTYDVALGEGTDGALRIWQTPLARSFEDAQADASQG